MNLRNQTPRSQKTLTDLTVIGKNSSRTEISADPESATDALSYCHRNGKTVAVVCWIPITCGTRGPYVMIYASSYP